MELTTPAPQSVRITEKMSHVHGARVLPTGKCIARVVIVVTSFCQQIFPCLPHSLSQSTVGGKRILKTRYLALSRTSPEAAPALKNQMRFLWVSHSAAQPNADFLGFGGRNSFNSSGSPLCLEMSLTTLHLTMLTHTWNLTLLFVAWNNPLLQKH